MALGRSVKKLSQRGKKPNSFNSVALDMPSSSKRIKSNLIRSGIHPAIVNAITKTKEKTNDGN
jgi:hypothetical protein